MQRFNIITIGLSILFAFVLGSISLKAQNNYVITHDDSLALENVIVEKYYVADSIDCLDTIGGTLPSGSVTYRIYIDMKNGYRLQTVYGVTNHELFIKTSTTFYNNLYCFAITGFNINNKELNENNVALDSWITMGAASRLHTGIIKDEDHDGSILKRALLSKSDGLTNGVFPTFKQFNLDLSFFKDNKNASLFATTNGVWAAFGGVMGPTADNKVLIAQLTTNGKLSFELNVQIGTPTAGVVQFVAKNPERAELYFKGLTYSMLKINYKSF